MANNGELEHQLRMHDGTALWCRTVMALVRSSSGAPDHVTAMVENIDERKQAEADLVHRTSHDPLTSLPNREHFLRRLAESRRESLQGTGVGVVFIDLDNFKSVNDSFGHEAGDELLVAVARRLRGAVRPSDLVARFGGDEFLVLAEDLDEARDAAQLAWRLASALHAPFAVAGRAVTVTASFGAVFSRDSDEPDEDLVRKADAAMYTAKHRGSNRVAVFGEAELALFEITEPEVDRIIQNGIRGKADREDGEFVAHHALLSRGERWRGGLYSTAVP